MTYLQAFIIAIIEGITEFLPVSSTGHMILASSLMDIKDKAFADTFEIVIQLGAILSVLVLYYKRFLVGIDIYLKLFVAFLPTAVVGLLAYKTIKAHLFNPYVVSVSLIVGGVILILLDKWSAQKESVYETTSDISFIDALKIGAIQCFSMIPGVSRSAATIFGGVFAGFNRKQAAEFSFLLAIPTMFVASAKDLYENKDAITQSNMMLLIFGSVIAFIVALIAVKAFVQYLTKHGFKMFGYYRIIIGLVFLAYALFTGLQLHA
ncbi:MAG: undecaprenyl-diphosphate phosphatase [Bacteroidia bacterium]|nr:undecaprenyl-diphosphate phosphatase [Bacteroidia bacterium]HQV00967.1 undecaprenyl-diphosphate phosphatase [Bacteroidia bacterium]